MTVQQLIAASHNLVFFGGAGVSTESGIPDFRSVDGLYNQKYPYPPETMLSHSFFMSHTAEFYDFYRDKMLYPNAQPNITHKVLAQFEQLGKLSAIVTQNIDGLHTAAGSNTVYELHGSVLRNYCMDCGKFYDMDYIRGSRGIPRCACGGIVKPDVVLYEEGLDDRTLRKAIAAIAAADCLIVGGTSLNVYPAASLTQYYKGDRLVLINKTPTPYDSQANLVLHNSLGNVFANLSLL